MAECVVGSPGEPPRGKDGGGDRSDVRVTCAQCPGGERKYAQAPNMHIYLSVVHSFMIHVSGA